MICLNCNEEITRKFCANCGQKADTHRITLKHFIAHDLMHGVWHIERGILFTAKQAILRPGQAALDYIAGKRIRYYNVFYLCLLAIAANIILNHLYDGLLPPVATVKKDSVFGIFFSENIKFLLLSIVPVFALNGWLLFRRLKLNLAEHFIIGGMTLLGILLWAFPLFLVKFLEQAWLAYIGILKVLFVLPLIFYPVWSYRNATKGLYKFPGFLWRIAVYMLLTLVELSLLLMVLLFAVTKHTNLEINF